MTNQRNQNPQSPSQTQALIQRLRGVADTLRHFAIKYNCVPPASEQHNAEARAVNEAIALLQASTVPSAEAPQNAQQEVPSEWSDNPVEQARRRAFDSPNIANIDALIETVRNCHSRPATAEPHAAERADGCAECAAHEFKERALQDSIDGCAQLVLTLRADKARLEREQARMSHQCQFLDRKLFESEQAKERYKADYRTVNDALCEAQTALAESEQRAEMNLKEALQAQTERDKSEHVRQQLREALKNIEGMGRCRDADKWHNRRHCEYCIARSALSADEQEKTHG